MTPYHLPISFSILHPSKLFLLLFLSGENEIQTSVELNTICKVSNLYASGELSDN